MALRTRNILSLCAGVGGLELGILLALHSRAEAGRGICYVEREAAAAASLVASMEGGWLHPAPVWSDMLTFDARRWRGHVHILASGDPCQENSVAGKRAGAKGARFLAPEVCRIADECRPDLIVRENVPGNTYGQLEAIVPALERLGYRVAAGIFSSAETGNSMRRERLFIMAERHGWRCGADGEPHGGQKRSGESAPLRLDADGCNQGLADVAVPYGGECGDRRVQRSGQFRLHSQGDGACGNDARLHVDGAARLGERGNVGNQARSQQTTSGNLCIEQPDEGCGWADLVDASAGHALGGAPDERHERSGRARGRRAGFTHSGVDFARPMRTELEGEQSRQHDPAGRQEPGRFAPLSGRAILPPAVIPGPTDSRWIDVLDRWPEYQPALSQEEAESHLRRGVDAMAHRIERLRATGNGVDPVVAAYAFLRLDALLAEAQAGQSLVMAA